MVESTYLVNQCKQSADLFSLSGSRGFGSEDFIEKVMTCALGQYLYSKECIDMWLGAAYVMETLESEISFQKGGILPEFFMQWVGYLFRYWSLTTEDTAAQIIEQASVEDLRQMYQGLHVMSYEEVIADLREQAVSHAVL